MPPPPPSIADGDVLRCQYLWEYPGRRRARTVFHLRASNAVPPIYPEDVATFYQTSFSLQVSELLSDPVVLRGTWCEVIAPTAGSSPPGGSSLEVVSSVAWGDPWLLWWGTRLLWSTTLGARARYDPWMVIPFTPAAEVTVSSGVPTVSDAYQTAVASLASIMVGTYTTSLAGSVDTTLCLWTRASQTTTDVVSYSSDPLMRHVRRRNVYWRELPFPV